MKVLIAGQKHFGRAVAELIHARDGWEIIGVACPVHGLCNSLAKLDSLHIFALNHAIPIIAAGTLNADSIDRVAKGIDLIVTAHSHDFIGRKTRLRTRLGGIGFHPSLLPLYRGRSAIEWQIKLGERTTGGTVYWLSDTVDGGNIAAQKHAFIPRNTSPAALWRNILQPLGLELFSQVFDELDAGIVRRTAQDAKLATWFPSLDEQPLLRRPDLPLLPSPGQIFAADKI